MKTDLFPTLSSRISFLPSLSSMSINPVPCLLVAAALLVNATPVPAGETSSSHPNIVLVLADDMGLESHHRYNDQYDLPMPAMDRMMEEGMHFTDAHSNSSVCTPTRYGLLTGRYAWRSRLKHGVLPTWMPPLIRESRLTVADMLRESGYHTACIGKWHLGFDYAHRDGGSVSEAEAFTDAHFSHQELCRQMSKIDWRVVDFEKPFKGPLNQGFDTFFGMDAPNFPPYTWMKDDRVTVLPTEPWTRKMGLRDGPCVPGWDPVEVMPEIGKQAVGYIAERAQARQPGDKRPFFLYFPLTSPHSPILPSEAFRGKSGKSIYGDFLMETDDALRQVLEALDAHNLADDTLVIFTSDNGTTAPSPDRELKNDLHLRQHLRGSKATVYEGGHRMPYLVRWPGVVPAGSVCDELICHTDFMATVAEIVGYDLPENAAEDSHSLLTLYRGSHREIVPPVVNHSARGNFAVRQGDWKLVLGAKDQPAGVSMLYNLRDDLGETTDVIDQHPERAAEMTSLLKEIIDTGRSTPGASQPNEEAEGGHWPLPQQLETISAP